MEKWYLKREISLIVTSKLVHRGGSKGGVMGDTFPPSQL